MKKSSNLHLATRSGTGQLVSPGVSAAEKASPVSWIGQMEIIVSRVADYATYEHVIAGEMPVDFLPLFLSSCGRYSKHLFLLSFVAWYHSC